MLPSARSAAMHVASLALRALVVLAPVAAPAEALAQTSSDSVSIAPGIRAAWRSVGASRAVVDSGDARVAAATTFSELMQARAASVGVMMSGGTLTDGGRFLIRGPSTAITSGAPLLVVDGIRMDDQEDDTLTTASRLDDIAVEDIASVEVLRGPAAATLYGAGASSGVIVVTTKRGAPGRLRVESRVLADSRRLTASFPDSYQRRGVSPSNGTPTNACWLGAVARGDCVPKSLEVWNLLDATAPFRTGAGALASVGVSGGSASRDARLSVRARRASGVGLDDDLSQVHSRLNATQRVGKDLDVNLHAAYVWSTSNRSATGNVISSGLSGLWVADSTAQFGKRVDTMYMQSADQRLRHLTGGVDAAWRRGDWITVRGAMTRDRADVEDVQGRPGFDFSAYNIPAIPPSEDHAWGHSERRVSRGSVELAHRVPGFGQAHGRLLVGTERTVRTRALVDTLGIGGGLSGYSEYRSSAVNSASFLSERATFGERFALGVGVRRERDTAADTGFRFLPGADASWLTPLALAGGGTLRLRAAYGESLQPFSSFLPLLNVSYSNLYYDIGGPRRTEEDDHPERMRETEGGVDVEWGARGRLAATVYQRRISGIYALAALPGGSGVFTRRVSSSGVELDASARLIDGRALRWELRGVGATQSNHVVGGTPLFGPDRSQLADGQPMWAQPGMSATFADANGDGILSDTEISISGLDQDLHSSTPTFEGALHSIVTFGNRVAVSAVLDRRSGFVSRPGSMVTHCRFFRCREAQDPSATIEEQAVMLAQFRGLPAATDASFTRLREISLRWSLAPALTRGGATRDATIVIAGRDLYTWTSWKGLDPEINGYPRGAIVRSDANAVPLPRRLMIGVELGAQSK